MQLTVREVSEYLEVAEATITRWIKQRGLPAQYVGGQYRFHRAELLEWATANHIKVSVRLFDTVETEPESVPSLAYLLALARFFTAVAALDTGSPFEGMGQPAK